MLTGSFFIAGLVLGAGAMGEQAMPRQSGQMIQGAAEQISAGDDLRQFSLQDRQGQQLGQIDQVLVDVQQGKIGYVVVTSQQQPGQKHVIPWNALQSNPQQQILTLRMSAQRFQQAPTGDAQMVRDMKQARQIHQFYGVSPYWEETMQRQQQQQFPQQRQ